MVNYYYARKEKEEDGVKYLEVPVIVNPETAKANNQHYSMVKIGYRQYPCVFEWIPESYYNTHKCMLEQEAKEDERDSRCLVPDPKKKGGRIRCPERNRCISCPYAGKLNFDNGHDTSLDFLMESGFDAETGIECESNFDAASSAAPPEDIIVSQDEMRCLNDALDAIIGLLADEKPKYGAIGAELRKGATNASEIARRCGLKPNRTAEDVSKVQAKARELYRKMK